MTFTAPRGHHISRIQRRMVATSSSIVALPSTVPVACKVLECFSSVPGFGRRLTWRLRCRTCFTRMLPPCRICSMYVPGAESSAVSGCDCNYGSFEHSAPGTSGEYEKELYCEFECDATSPERGTGCFSKRYTCGIQECG